jgi:hypothetical protein
MLLFLEVIAAMHLQNDYCGDLILKQFQIGVPCFKLFTMCADAAVLCVLHIDQSLVSNSKF